MLKKITSLLAVGLTLGFSSVGRGQVAGPKWILTTADFKSDPVTLAGFDASGLKVTTAENPAPRSIPLDQFLDVQRPLPPVTSPAKFTLHMAGGDKLGGEPVNLTAEALVWRNATLGEISIPTGGLIGFTRHTTGTQTNPGEQGREDVVTLSNGDTVRGIIASMSGQSATVQTGAGNSEVPLDSITSISFAATPGAGPPKHGFRVRLDDGSSLVGTEAKLDSDNLDLTLAKDASRKIPIAHVAAIEQLNGPVSWLSSRAPSEAVSFPFVGPARQVPAYMDRAFDTQGPIEFKGTQFPHGIAVHAFSRIVWPLDPSYIAFRTRYAIEGDSTLADVTVRIKLDDKVVYEKQHVRSGSLSSPIVQDLNGAKTLIFEVDGGSAYAQDALDWIEPALLKKPAEPTR
ncbi:MAG TPA: NPCBM/NEW2 domain-containing protein [Tepidisphaeraceae bacterium]